MQKEIKAVIFDFDGVLSDNTSVIVDIYQEDAKRLGLKIPNKKDVVAVLGLPWREMVETLFGKDDSFKEKHLEVWPEYQNKMSLVPGLKDLLDKLNQKKGIVTSRTKDRTTKELGDLTSYFKVIIAEEDTQNHKPHPEPLLKACAELNVEPGEVIYVGDHIRDFEMARNAGADFIGVLSGAISEEEFKNAGAKRTISSLDELLDALV